MTEWDESQGDPIYAHAKSYLIVAIPEHNLTISFLIAAPAYENIKIEVVGAKKNVGIVQLNRPKALNALCKPLFIELGLAVKNFDADDSIAAIIITGENWWCIMTTFQSNLV